MSFGAIPFLGVERWWDDHPTFRVVLCRGLPGYPSQVLLGTETAAQLANPWMVSVILKPSTVALTFFFSDYTSAMTALRNRLTLVGVNPARIARIKDRLDGRPDLGADVAAAVTRHIKMDLD